jgi:galactose mutarotase-like enzyme
MASRYSVRSAIIKADSGTVDVVTLEDHEAKLTVSVAPSQGGEICSVKHRGVELVYKAFNYGSTSASEWRGKAPVLFPAVGRQRDGKYNLAGKPTEMPIHGFASSQEFRVKHSTHDAVGAELSVSLSSADISGDITACYPFIFELEITYRLANGIISVSHQIKHLSDSTIGASGMPFGIGNHITFNFPFEGHPDSSWDKGTIVSKDVSHEFELTPGSLLSGVTNAVPFTAGIPLTYSSTTNGVFGQDPASDPKGCISLVLRDGDRRGVRISQCIKEPPADWTPEYLTRINHALYFVLWGEKSKGFLCVEPWLTGPNSLNDLIGTPVLSPGDSLVWEMAISIE